MKRKELTQCFRDYLRGVDYYGRVGLLQNARLNEAFYCGNQWCDDFGNKINTNGVPAPVFNLFKQIINYLISTMLAKDVRFNYSVEGAPLNSLAHGDDVDQCCARLSKYAGYKWERLKMDSILADALLDAALSGNGVFYTYWDSMADTGGVYKGDFVTRLINNTNVFPADPSMSDFDKQDYIIVSARADVNKLKAEAIANGADELDAESIVSDVKADAHGRRLTERELAENKCTFLIKFWRDPDTRTIKFQKFTRYTAITPEIDTGLRHYPLVHFAWDRKKDCWLGNAVATSLVPNQRYINQSFSMVMYHMMMTAFSKIVYNADRIDGEWDNSVGAAIPVIGDVDNVAKVIECGQMQPQMLETINKAISFTKELTGATDVALGLANPDNASALAAMHNASLVPLEITKRNLYAALEQLGIIWLDFMNAYFPDDRVIVCGKENGAFNGSCLRSCASVCKIELTPIDFTNSSLSIETLNRLLDKGYITLEQYLERIPNGIVPAKQEIIKSLRNKGEN